MIFVDGLPFQSNSFQESNTLVALMEHPSLQSASQSLKAMQEKRFSVSEDCGQESSAQGRWVYIFQREFATVDPALVDFIGTDEATTCVGLVIWNPKTGMTSVAHMDSPEVVDTGLTQMLSLVVDQNLDVNLHVHLIGAFEEVPPNHTNGISSSNGYAKPDGYSEPLCAKIIETLKKRPEKFHIQTLFVLGHNTMRDSQGNACPIFQGFLIDTSSGSLVPASFNKTTMCPDEIVRRIRVTACFEDFSWKGKLLETYDTQSDRFVIAPCHWTFFQLRAALMLEQLADAEILIQCSTSPSAEGPDFVENMRRQWKYLIEHPNWQDAFPKRQPRIFERTAKGGWKRC